MGKKQNTFEKHRREADKKRKAEDNRKPRLTKKQDFQAREPNGFGDADDESLPLR